MSWFKDIFNPVWRQARGIRDLILQDAKLQAAIAELETSLVLATVEYLTTLLEHLVIEISSRGYSLPAKTKARLALLLTGDKR